jgi:thioredoxin 1
MTNRQSAMVEVDDDTFEAEVLRAEGTVLVDCTAAWCAPCRALEPVLEQLADENRGTLKVAKVDVDRSPGVAKRFGIRGAPTLLVFRDGERRASHLGVTTKEKLLELVRRG